jgi:uncharacterized protein YacL
MEIIIIILLLIIMAEVSYLAAVNTKRLSHKKEIKPIFVDTSVLIDGRIIAVAGSGFIDGTLSIPRSVIGELQFLADNSDAEKRSRARHGLDVVTELQNMPNVKVEIFQDGSRAKEGVDERLLSLAKKYQGVICTIDYNLNKVARVDNIKVLNVNDLAMSLRMSYLPGEKMSLELIQKGQDAHQAVGHLPDGTMVVVEHANNKIGQIVEVEFVRSLQTAAGKMMFAKLVNIKPPIKNNYKKVVALKAVKPIVTKPITNPVSSTQRNNNQRLNKNPNRKNRYKNKSAQNEQNFIDLLNKQ